MLLRLYLLCPVNLQVLQDLPTKSEKLKFNLQSFQFSCAFCSLIYHSIFPVLVLRGYILKTFTIFVILIFCFLNFCFICLKCEFIPCLGKKNIFYEIQ